MPFVIAHIARGRPLEKRRRLGRRDHQCGFGDLRTRSRTDTGADPGARSRQLGDRRRTSERACDREEERRYSRSRFAVPEAAGEAGTESGREGAG